MAVFQRILVPTDFSESADAAFRLAILFARTQNAQVHLLHDLEVPVETITGATIVGEQIERETAEAQRKMDERVAAAGAADHVAERTVDRSTNPVHAIPLFAGKHDVDLIVMGAHGHHSVNEKLLGSRAERVLRDAPCPVLTVSATNHYAVPERISHLLVPVDPAEPTTAPLATAGALASSWNARLSVLEAETDGGGRPEALTRLLDQHPALSQSTEVIASSEAPTDAILGAAASNGVDLIVMHTHARKGVSRLFKGSVAEDVVSRAPCPVLAVPPAADGSG